MTTPVFNDLLFASAEAQEEFHAHEQTLTVDAAARLRSVLGKPSQFVGRVTTLALALEHWRLWEEWQATEGAALAGAGAPATDGDGEKRGPGRPMLQRTIEIQAAREAWKKAIADEKAALDKINAWEQQQIQVIRAQARQARLDWDKHVRDQRTAFRAAKGE